jgi:preprotein translocase subunit SecY
MKKLFKPIGYTFLLIFIFRLGVHIPVPGVDPQAIQSIVNSDAFSIFNLFNGGALSNFSIFALGVSPYITASIIIQLLQMDISPTFVEWSKQGEVGRRKLTRATVLLSIFFGFIQGLGIAFGFNQFSNAQFVADPTILKYVVIAIFLTVGSTVLTLLGEYTNDRGLGNGISTVIFASILSRVPNELYQAYENNLMINVIVAFLIIFAIIVYIELAQLRIPMYYSKKFSGELTQSWLPLKLNSAGVIPVIFASSVFSVPQLMNQLLYPAGYEHSELVKFLLECFTLASKKGVITYAILVIMFTFFYAQVQINPEKVADSLAKSSGYIYSVRPGEDTEKYLSSKIRHLSVLGSIYLVAITVLPIATIFHVTINTSLLSGTSLLILIGVAAEMSRQIRGKLTFSHYQSLID